MMSKKIGRVIFLEKTGFVVTLHEGISPFSFYCVLKDMWEFVESVSVLST